MVICRYCGQENRTGDLRCSNCGKPLSLLPNDPSDPTFEKDLDQKSNEFHKETIRKDSIKWKYINPHSDQEKGSDSSDDRFNDRIEDHGDVVDFNYNPSDRDFVDRSTDFNDHDDGGFDQNDHDEDELYRAKFHENIGRYKDNNLDFDHEKKTENLVYFIEWDVIIASSLIVIILTAIFNRMFPIFGYISALLVSLIYVLIATKNKNTLFLAIPLSFISTAAISAFLSI
ncbi:MAG: hypothetical protein LBC39_06100 [Methanobrevibacter sp.]|jgi:hypothetical protein|nr:hypothetical protein [Candidatus Methanovirga aequatorialis]